MNRLFLILLFFLIDFSLLAQPFEESFRKDLSPNFFDYFLSSGQKGFYLSSGGESFFFTSDLRYTLLSASDGKLIAEGKHIKKNNAGIASILGVLKNKSFNREDAVEKTRFDEGTEYMVFEEENLIVVLDWNADQNIVKAIDLLTGEVKWEVDRYRYSASSKSQMFDLILGMANAGRLQRKTPRNIAVANAMLQGYGEGAMTGEKASLAAYGFLTPLPGSGKFLLRVQDKHVAIDLKTGAEAWVYDKRKLNIGFAQMANEKELVFVNFSSSYFQANERLIVRLNIETGEEVWTAQHLSDFREGRTYMTDDRLICDYYGAEVFDLQTGERILLTIDERTVKTQNAMTRAFMSDGTGSRGTEAIASPSLVEGPYLYSSVFKLGKRAYANDGSSKAIVSKYDLRSGEKLWESDKLDRGTDLSYASSEHVFVRKGQALGKSSLSILDAASGELLTQTKSIDGFISREGAGDILTNQYLYRAGKKSIYAFDTDDWSLSREFDTKKSKVGKLQALVPASNELMAVGDKGLVFFDAKGKAEDAIQTDPIIGTYWTDTHGFIFTTKDILAVDLDERKIASKLNASVQNGVQVLFSEDASRMMLIKGGQYLMGYKNP